MSKPSLGCRCKSSNIRYCKCRYAYHSGSHSHKGLKLYYQTYKKTDLFASIQIALKSKSKPETSFLLIRDNNTNLKLNFEEILYMEGNSNYINIFTKTQKVVTRQSLKWAELELPENLFMRIHRSYFVNLRAVQRANSKSVFIGEIEIPISRVNASKISDYLRKKTKT